MPLKQDKVSILVETARLYYEYGLSQDQIAKKLGISRPGVSRLLKQGRDRGIIKIEIIDPYERGTKIEFELKNKFGLKQAVVVPHNGRDTHKIKDRLGLAAITLLDSLLKTGSIIGISWGTTMQAVTRKLKSRRIKNMVVVQLNGGISRADYDTHASEITQKIGENYQAAPYLLPLPAVVDSAHVKQTIISDKNISRTLKLARQADIAMFTVGSFGYNSVLVKADYFEQNEVDELLKRGAVGDICSRIIDHNGQLCSQELDARTIGIELDELKNKPYSIAVAGGKEKLRAIRAGLKGSWFNILITDEFIANELLYAD